MLKKKSIQEIYLVEIKKLRVGCVKMTSAKNLYMLLKNIKFFREKNFHFALAYDS